MFKLALLLVVPALLSAQPGNNRELRYQRAVRTLFQLIDINDDSSFVQIEQESYFLSFDRDEDGQLSRQEFSRALHHASSFFSGHEDDIFELYNPEAGSSNSSSVTRADLDDAFVRSDEDGNSRVTDREFEEFYNVTVPVGPIVG